MTDKSLIELETIRAEFEAWYVAGRNHFAKYELQPDEHGRYFNPFVQAGWAAWQAARLAVVPSAPEAGDWGIDLSTGRKILVYKNCSVIEDAQAELVLSLLAAAPQSPAIAAERGLS